MSEHVVQLLSQVKGITDSYARLREARGENFNIFSVLGIEHSEETTHSRFIAELLNPHASQGLGAEFLKLFINTLDIDTAKQIDASKCKVSTEVHFGKVQDTTGGRVDIFIQEGASKEHVIMIENKVHSGETGNQLERYHNEFPMGTLLFLTKDGRDSECADPKKTTYTPISYQRDMLNWLAECKKVAVDNPTIRETITQYINLIKKLTHQEGEQKMYEDLAKIFTESEEHYEALLKLNSPSLRYSLYEFAIKERLIPALEQLKENLKHCKIKYNKEELLHTPEPLFSVENDEMKSKNIKIGFVFKGGRSDKRGNLAAGFYYIDNNTEKTHYNYDGLRHSFEKRLGNYKGVGRDSLSSTCLCAFYYDGYRHWSALNNLRRVIHKNENGDTFEVELSRTVSKMLEVFNNSF